MSTQSGVESLAEAINSLGSSFAEFTPSGTFVEWNDQFKDVTGYADEEISNLNVTDIVIEEERGTVNEALATVAEDSDEVVFSTALLNPGKASS